MPKIQYVACPECGAFTALEGPDIDRPKVHCFGCGVEFPLVKEFLKTLDDIVEEEGDGSPRGK